MIITGVVYVRLDSSQPFFFYINSLYPIRRTEIQLSMRAFDIQYACSDVNRCCSVNIEWFDVKLMHTFSNVLSDSKSLSSI